MGCAHRSMRFWKEGHRLHFYCDQCRVSSKHGVCRMCRMRGKIWEGDDPRCFMTGDNWSCATFMAIRDVVYEGNKPIRGVLFHHTDDRKTATIDIADIEEVPGLTLWVSWFKNRGKTDALWILSHDAPPRLPTEDELLAILAAYQGQMRERGYEGADWWTGRPLPIEMERQAAQEEGGACMSSFCLGRQPD